MPINGEPFNGRKDTMHTIDIGLETIDRIYHVADIHIRNVKRHKDYELVFKKLYAYIKKTKTPNSVIYLAGDIVHAKTDMSPELVYQVANFFRRLADIAPVLLITGNHDCNLNNSNRLDALSPIVTAVNHPNIHYLKDNGVYCISGVHFSVMSVFNKPAEYVRASDFDGKIKIALHHGAVNNAATDAGFTLSNTHVTTEIFDGFDLTLLGDIHKMQFLNNENTIAYAGSLIQQNHGEGLEHGILVWDIETKKSEFVKIENVYGYYTFNVVNGEIQNPSPDVPKKPRLRIKVTDTDSADLKSIISKLRQLYSVQEIAIQKVNSLNTTNSQQKINFGDVRDVEWQNTNITDYLSNEFAVDDKTLDVVRHINRLVHSRLPESELTRNVIWTPKYFEFSNMFSYGENNVIDFDNIHGTNGLFAPNASGKSTLLDALTFCCFDKCSRTSKAINVLNNKKSSFKCKFAFDLNGKIYVIERTGSKNGKGHVKVDVNFWHEDVDGTIELLNGDQRDSTNKIIRQFLGSYEDFVLTALSIQNNNSGFIDKSQRERKDLLSQFLDIDIFELQYQLASDDIRETASIIKEYNRQDHPSILASNEQLINQYEVPLQNMLTEREQHMTMYNDLTDIIMSLTAELKHIDSEISDVKSLETSKGQLVDHIVTLRETLFHKKDYHSNITRELQNVSTLLETYDIQQLQASANELERHEIEIARLKNELVLLDRIIDHAQSIVSKLEQHQWDPNCQFCVANPWLQETIDTSKQLPKLHEQRRELSSQLDDMKTAYDVLMLEKIFDRLNEYSSLKTRQQQLENDVQRAQNDTDATINKLNIQDEKLKVINRNIAIAVERKDDIEFNKKKREEINDVRNEQQQLKEEIDSLDEKIIHISGKLQVAKNTKDEAIKSIARLKELEIQYKGYEYYLLAVKRDGVPYKLITKALPQLELEINNILNQVVDFSIMLETDGKNINAYIVYDDVNFWPIELTSGMEKFIASLAIRASLINITSLPRPNFLAIDEGFGVLDSDNLNSMYLLFDYLKSQFGFILCISHIDAMRDVVDRLIEIKKVNGYSQINYS